MSAHEHGHGHDDHHEEIQFIHATYGGYFRGFLLSVILTAIPFALVMGDVFENSLWAIAIIFGLGAIQIVVHMVYFLHIDAKGEDGWNLLSLIYSGMLIVIMLAGSIWIMVHLHENTMPMHPTAEETRHLP